MRDTSGQDVHVQPKGRLRTVALATVTVLALGAGALVMAPKFESAFSADMTVPSDALRFATVSRGDLQRDIAVQGQVVAANSPTLYAPSNGTVSLMVKAGSQVNKGQLLGKIDSPELANLHAQEQSTLEELEMEIGRQQIQIKTALLNNQQSIEMAAVELELMKNNKRRAEISISQSLISQVEFEQDLAELKKSQLQHQHAIQRAKLERESLEFELKSRQLQLDRQQFVVDDLTRQVNELNILSPIDGIIGSVYIREKDNIARNSALITVVDLSVFEVEVNIPENYADDLGVGLFTEISFNGQTHGGELTAISPEVSNGQVVGRLRFAGETPQGLRQNQRVSARVLIESKSDVLKLRRGGFVESGGGRIAYVVDEQTAQRTPIQLGARSIGEVEVLSGLNVGDNVVISDIDQFNGNQRIYLTN